MKILHIETSSINCSVAISINSNIISCVEQIEANIHASQLTLFIEQVLLQASISLNDLDAVSVGAGPGSYTGLRIGVSTAKGLCYALGIPLISCSSLYNLYSKAKDLVQNENVQIIPLIDARRMEVYSCRYNFNGEILEQANALIIDQDTFKSQLEKHPTLFIGDGAAKVEALYQNNTQATFSLAYPSAMNMLEEALLKFEKKSFEDVAYFEPFYLKEFYFNK